MVKGGRETSVLRGDTFTAWRFSPPKFLAKSCSQKKHDAPAIGSQPRHMGIHSSVAMPIWMQHGV
jgi:hypothetical protein